MEYLNVENARSWIQAAALLISENAAMLTELDTAIGDGDHGENMMRGFKAVEKKLETSAPPGIGHQDPGATSNWLLLRALEAAYDRPSAAG